MERHRHRHTEIFKLRGTNTLREAPSSKKGDTLLRLKYTHTLRQKNVINRNEPHTHTLGETYMHRAKDTHGERDKSTWRNTQRDMQTEREDRKSTRLNSSHAT